MRSIALIVVHIIWYRVRMRDSSLNILFAPIAMISSFVYKPRSCYIVKLQYPTDFVMHVRRFELSTIQNPLE